MNENEPTAATDHVVVIAPETVGDGLESETPPRPRVGRPTWERANLGDVWGWIGVGACGVIGIEILIWAAVSAWSASQ